LKKEYRAGDELTVKVERIVPRGLGIAFVDGLTIFVSLAATGDTVKARLAEVRGATGFAEIVEITEPSPDRIDPPCEYFGVCGGCDFQQMDYSAQLAAKSAMIRDCIYRIGKIDWPEEIKVIPSPGEFGYRLRAQWHARPGTGEIGYYKRNSRELVDIKKCLVITDELQREMDRLRGELETMPAGEGLVQIDAACGDAGACSVYSADLVEPTNKISFTAAGERLRFSARSFFQGNRFLVDRLVEAAVGGYAGGTALDLYCGVGLFTLPLAREFESVIGVEENEQAVEHAQANAEQAGLANIDFYVASVGDYLASGEAPKPGLVVLDPPRAGTEKETMRNLIALGPEHVSYVACEPSILARDLKRFVEAGYRIESITALDLFPQTHHVETVARLRKT
jgi:23S rRNA (uracil1939-C5)-methyltransferase